MADTFTVALNFIPMYLEYKDWCPGSQSMTVYSDDFSNIAMCS